MQKAFIDVFTYLFEFLLFLYYSNTLFKRKRSASFTVICALAGHAVLFTAYRLVNITYLNAILLFAVNFLMLYLLFEVSYKTAIFHSLIFVSVMFGAEILTMIVSNFIFKDLNAFENNISAYLFIVIASKIIYLTIMMFVLKFFAARESNDGTDRHFWVLFIVPLSTLLMLLAFRYITYEIKLSYKMNILLTVASLFLLFSNILVFIIYEQSIKNTKELYRLKAQEYRREQDKKYFEAIERSNNDMRVFAHNIKNQLTQIRNLDDINEIRNYIDCLYPDLEKFSKTGISKNKTLDLILSKYTSLCDKYKIKLDIDVKTANLSYINSTDLSNIMNNLLDNALESALKSNEKFINIKIFSKNKLYDGLIISNSCDSAPRIKNGRFASSKADAKNHGLGVAGVKKTLKKYSAIYDWNYNAGEHIFTTTIAFNKN